MVEGRNRRKVDYCYVCRQFQKIAQTLLDKLIESQVASDSPGAVMEILTGKIPTPSIALALLVLPWFTHLP